MKIKQLLIPAIFSIFILNNLIAENTNDDFKNHHFFNNVVTYDMPEEARTTADLELTANGKAVDVITTEVNLNRTYVDPYQPDLPEMVLSEAYYARFDVIKFRSKVKIEIKKENLESVKIRPVKENIQYEIIDNTLCFTVDVLKHKDLTIEFNNDYTDVLHLSIDKFLPGPNIKNPNVIVVNPGDPLPANDMKGKTLYFAPGYHHDIGEIIFYNNMEVYFAGGAIVECYMWPERVKNVRIYGRGIVDQHIYPRTEHVKSWNTLWGGPDPRVPLNIGSCSNVFISGISFLGNCAWTVNSYKSENIVIRNLDVIGARQNTDGISIRSSKNVLVSGCFVRSWDDSLVVKNHFGEFGTEKYQDYSTENIFFINNILWTDLAQSMEVGYETIGPEMNNIKFINTTVLHNFHKPVISLHNGAEAKINGVSYINTTVEDNQMGEGDGENVLIDIYIGGNPFVPPGTQRGTVSNVHISGVTVLEGKIPRIQVKGANYNHTVKKVYINDIHVLGEEWLSADQFDYITNPFISQIYLEGTLLPVIEPETCNIQDQATGKYLYDDGLILPEITFVKTDEQINPASPKANWYYEETDSGHIRIINRYSGNNIHVEHLTGKVENSSVPDGFWSNRWSVKGLFDQSNDTGIPSGYVIENGWQNSNYLYVNPDFPELEYKPDQASLLKLTNYQGSYTTISTMPGEDNGSSSLEISDFEDSIDPWITYPGYHGYYSHAYLDNSQASQGESSMAVEYSAAALWGNCEFTHHEIDSSQWEKFEGIKFDVRLSDADDAVQLYVKNDSLNQVYASPDYRPASLGVTDGEWVTVCIPFSSITEPSWRDENNPDYPTLVEALTGGLVVEYISLLIISTDIGTPVQQTGTGNIDNIVIY
ncbi:MAG: hypothetical protein MJB14_00930 [Spirochaetes bacterium]|nr:hypothetical protein [Spirochaetota bacterium]